MIDCHIIRITEEQGTTELMEERIIDTVEAYQALEAVVTRKGYDYVDPGTSHGGNWFTDWDETETADQDDFYILTIPTAYSCITGHWMGEVGLTMEEAHFGYMPVTWRERGGRISKKSPVRVTPEVERMFMRVPAWNDARMRWGTILERVREQAFGASVTTPEVVAEEVVFA